MKILKAALVASAFVSIVQGCAHFGGKPNTESHVRAVERRLETTSVEIEKIYASIQQTLEILMRHEADIRELEAVIEKEKSFPDGPSPVEELSDSVILRGIDDGEAGFPPLKEELAAVPDQEKIAKPQDPKSAYDHALAVFQKEHFQEAIALFDNFEARFPDHDLADNALYWKGECFYTLRLYEESIRIFEKVATEYATGNKVPDSFLKIGLARLSLNDRDIARNYFEKVIGEYPDTPAAAKASKTLEKIHAET